MYIWASFPFFKFFTGVTRGSQQASKPYNPAFRVRAQKRLPWGKTRVPKNRAWRRGCPMAHYRFGKVSTTRNAKIRGQPPRYLNQGREFWRSLQEWRARRLWNKTWYDIGCCPVILVGFVGRRRRASCKVYKRGDIFLDTCLVLSAWVFFFLLPRYFLNFFIKIFFSFSWHLFFLLCRGISPTYKQLLLHQIQSRGFSRHLHLFIFTHPQFTEFFFAIWAIVPINRSRPFPCFFLLF